jgi:hypothetical protein
MTEILNLTKENALSFNDIKDMSQEELDSLISVCFHEGKLRTYETGISNPRCVVIKNWFRVIWEEDDDTNDISVSSLDEKIHVNGDEWSYGIYKA